MKDESDVTASLLKADHAPAAQRPCPPLKTARAGRQSFHFCCAAATPEPSEGGGKCGPQGPWRFSGERRAKWLSTAGTLRCGQLLPGRWIIMYVEKGDEMADAGLVAGGLEAVKWASENPGTIKKWINGISGWFRQHEKGILILGGGGT